MGRVRLEPAAGDGYHGGQRRDIRSFILIVVSDARVPAQKLSDMAPCLPAKFSQSWPGGAVAVLIQ